jgi:hypothetical protein
MVSRVGVYHCFARSGGTLVNRLLGASRGVVVLSEVGPAVSVREPLVQAVEWLGLVTPGEIDALRDRDFGALIADLAGRAAAHQNYLVVRDFVTPNFLPGAFGDTLPSCELELVEALDGAGCEMSRVVVARRSASVYASIVRSFPHLADLSVDEFAVGYHAFVAAVDGVPVIRYEDLTADPPNTFQSLSAALGCAYDPQAIDRFAAFRNCTGDLQLDTPSRGASLDRIAPLADPATDPAFLAAAAHPLCRAADERFGYAPIGDAIPDGQAIVALETVLGDARRRLIATVQAQRTADDAVARARAEAEDARARAEAARERAEAAEHEMQRLAEDLAASMGRAVDLEETARALQIEVMRLQRAWDQTSGELARAEGIAAHRQRQVEELLAQLAPAEGGDRA